MAAFDVHLAVQAVDVALDRMDGDVEGALDLLIALAVDHELQDFHFAGRQTAGLPYRGEVEPPFQDLAQAARPGDEVGFQPNEGQEIRIEAEQLGDAMAQSSAPGRVPDAQGQMDRIADQDQPGEGRIDLPPSRIRRLPAFGQQAAKPDHVEDIQGPDEEEPEGHDRALGHQGREISAPGRTRPSTRRRRQPRRERPSSGGPVPAPEYGPVERYVDSQDKGGQDGPFDKLVP